jgi:GTP cyclohydrolase II
MLNCTRTVLLTNNRATLYGFTKTGIEIASRMPLEMPINSDNRRYVTAKAVRAGHRFNHLTASLADQS